MPLKVLLYYAALRGTDEDLERIRQSYELIKTAQENGGLEAESDAVLQYQLIVTEAAHNVVFATSIALYDPMLEQNIRQNFEFLYTRKEMYKAVSEHRAQIFAAIMAREPEKHVKLLIAI